MQTTSVENSFICPMTLEVMNDPVTHCQTGQTFEREAILHWMYTGNLTCPLTRTCIHPSDFKANLDLKKSIDQWKVEHDSFSHCATEANDDDLSSSLDRFVGSSISRKDEESSAVWDDDSFIEGIVALVEPLKRKLARERELRRSTSAAFVNCIQHSETGSSGSDRPAVCFSARRASVFLQQGVNREKRISTIRERVLNNRDNRLRSLGETPTPLASIITSDYGCTM